jgi:hypothetical protein
MKNYFLLLCYLFLGSLGAQECFQSSFALGNSGAFLSGNQLSISPEISTATYKAGEVKQKGYLYGIGGSYDLLVLNSPYLGFETYYMKGRLKGSGVESTYRDFLFEGKFGMTFGVPSAYFLTPYAGIGYENEKNDYTTTPIEKIDYYYISVGGLSSIYLSPQFTAGLNFKVKFPFTGDHKVKKEETDVNLSVSKRLQYVLEVPLTYWASPALAISAVPYYEYKNYNNNSIEENWNTKATMSQWGLTLKANLAF